MTGSAPYEPTNERTRFPAADRSPKRVLSSYHGTIRTESEGPNWSWVRYTGMSARCGSRLRRKIRFRCKQKTDLIPHGSVFRRHASLLRLTGLMGGDPDIAAQPHRGCCNILCFRWPAENSIRKRSSCCRIPLLNQFYTLLFRNQFGLCLISPGIPSPSSGGPLQSSP